MRGGRPCTLPQKVLHDGPLPPAPQSFIPLVVMPAPTEAAAVVVAYMMRVLSARVAQIVVCLLEKPQNTREMRLEDSQLKRARFCFPRR